MSASAPALVQILVDLKSNDPTAVTAFEALRTLLGFGDRLAELRRRELHEIVVAGSSGVGEGSNRVDAAELGERMAGYLDRTVLLWNPNKQRAWLRFEVPGDPAAEPSEILPGPRRVPGAFGRPDACGESYDHVLVWRRGEGDPPSDLARSVAPWRVVGYGRGELYSLRWNEGEPGDRETWTDQVAVARSRVRGLLVNPHDQDHRILRGPVPIRLWSHLD